jgi:REP element-mobilizing transposase RayT
MFKYVVSSIKIINFLITTTGNVSIDMLKQYIENQRRRPERED